MTYYFAYGSNMGSAQMVSRCRQSQRLGLAILNAYRWIIATDGYAGVIPAPDNQVEGVLFTISESDETSLDVFEEIHIGSCIKSYLPVLHKGEMINALVYLNASKGEGSISPEYIPRMLAAIADADLSKTYYDRYLHPIFSGHQ